MTPIKFLLVLLGATLLGVVSFIFVVGTARVLEKACGFNREGAIALLTLAGIAVTIVANHYRISWLGVGGLFFGWVILVPEAIIVMGIYHLSRMILPLLRRRRS